MLAGTWEALLNGQVDLAIGARVGSDPPPGVQVEPLGDMTFIFAVAPRHPLAAQKGPVSDGELALHRAIAVADSALHQSSVTVNVLPGQDVLTVPSLQAKVEALARRPDRRFFNWELGHPYCLPATSFFICPLFISQGQALITILM